MEDNIFTLKKDLQQCIANNINILDTNYYLLLFDKNTMNLIQSFFGFENLEIFPHNSSMKFRGEIAKDLCLSKEDLNKIKTIAWNYSMNEIMYQTIENQKSEEQKENERFAATLKMEEILNKAEEQEYKYRKPSEYERQLIKYIQEELNKIGLELDYEEHEEILMLCANFKYLKFEKDELRKLIKFAQKVDNFIIASIYDEEDEEDEECKSIRIVLAIDLREE